MKQSDRIPGLRVEACQSLMYIRLETDISPVLYHGFLYDEYRSLSLTQWLY